MQSSYKYLVLLLLMRVLPGVPSSSAQLLINEFCASNNRIMIDSLNREYSDWIEIENTSAESINLEGYYLSDDPDEPLKYRIDNRIMIMPGEYTVFIADKRGSSDHTSFRLSASGEAILLSDPNGSIIDSVHYGRQQTGISMGRDPSRKDRWLYFSNPSPGRENQENGSPAPLQSVFRHSLPVISISMDSTDLWGDSTGIYVVGKNGITGYCNELIRRNYCRDWERKAFFEYYDESGRRQYAGNAGIKIHGNCSRNFPQKSFALFARGHYGNGSFEYPFFDEKDINEFEALILRNSGNDNRNSMIRDALMSRLAGWYGGIDYQAWEPVVVYLNEKYWGIYNLREKINEHYVFDNHGLDPDRMDMLDNLDQVKYGDSGDINKLISFITNNPLSESRNYSDVASQIDIPSFINYMIASIYCANTDWPSNNVRYWKEKIPGSKWRWILFDTDLGFGLHEEGYSTDMFNKMAGYYENEAWITPNTVFLFMELMKSPLFREKFREAFYSSLATRYSPGNVIHEIDLTTALIAEEMKNHCERWNLSYTEWQEEIEKMRQFAALRPDFLKEHFERFVERFE